jgi:hypothetical protein
MALAQMYGKGGAEAAVVTLLCRLVCEVEALPEALAGPETPDAVRHSYRQAYERTALLSHNSAGSPGGIKNVLDSFFPGSGHALAFAEPGGEQDEPYAAELAMLGRLGATEDEKRRFRDELETASKLT